MRTNHFNFKTKAVCLSICFAIILPFLSISDIFKGASAAPAGYLYYTSDYANRNDARAAGLALNEQIVEEGIVLLKNANNALPLGGSPKVSVFGKSSHKFLLAGRGSAADGRTNDGTTLYDGLTAAGMSLNPTLMDFYKNDSQSGAGFNTTTGMGGTSTPTGETPIASVKNLGTGSYGEYGDAAIVVYSRWCGESSDLTRVTATQFGGSTPVAGARNTTDHYLRLDANEIALLQHCMDNFNKVIVLVNTGGNAMELGFLDDPDHYVFTDNGYAKKNGPEKIQAALIVGMPGNSGTKPIGKVLTGQANPSGKLTDTYVRDLKQDPTWQNFGTNLTGGGQTSVGGSDFVQYDEDIYIGYRYYETRYATEAAGTRDAWYQNQVVFPFGHGLSYSNFKIELLSSGNSGTGTNLDKFGTVTTKVRVTNEGPRKGKEVVQLYYNAPYKTGGIAKAHVVLGGFEKTGLLDPEQSQELTIVLKIEDMYSYDWSDANKNGFKGYELEAGDYNIVVARDAHEAAKLLPAFTTKYTVAGNGYQYDEDTTTGAPVGNLFDDVSVNRQGVRKYFSRDDWAGTWPMNGADKRDVRQVKKVIDVTAEGDSYAPYYTDVMPTQAKAPGTSSSNTVKLWHLIGREFDDAMWDLLLDQLTVSEMATVIGNGGGKTLGIPSINKPETKETDGPLGWRDGGGAYYASTVILAQTFNKELAYRMGVELGNEGILLNRNGIYAPGVNIHRSAFGGRNFEYYSEDGYLSGIFAANTIQGAKTKGIDMFLKHFVANDQETSRNAINTWLSEQALREIYTRPFEICVKKGATALMSSYNRLGDIETPECYALNTLLLRKEWGFNGCLITDWGAYWNMNAAVRAGNDLCMQAGRVPTIENTPTNVSAIRSAMKHILYMLCNSSAMNGLGGTTQIAGTTYEGLSSLYGVEGVDNSYSVDKAKSFLYPQTKYSYAVKSGSNLPAGMSLASDGTLSGAPTTPGDYSFTVVAKENSNAMFPYEDAEMTFNMTVYAANAIPQNVIYEDNSLNTAAVGIAYSSNIATAATFDATGHLTTDITYSLKDGSDLPKGLLLIDGVIQGIPAEEVTDFIFTVVASYTGKVSAELEFSITITTYVISYQSFALADGFVGKAFSQNIGIATSNGKIAINYVLKVGDSLPDGLVLLSNGRITGVPKAAVTDHSFTVVASSPMAAEKTEAQFTISVYGIVLKDYQFDMLVSKQYKFEINGSTNDGTTPTIIFELKEGSILPKGLTLLADGTIFGAATELGPQTFTVIAIAPGYTSVETTVTINVTEIYAEEPGEEEEEPKVPPKGGCNNSASSIGALLTLMLGFAVISLRNKK